MSLVTSPSLRFSGLKERAFRDLDSLYQHPVARVSFELVATTIAVLLLAMLIIRPTLSSSSQLLKDIEDRKKTHDSLIENAAALSSLNNEVLRLKSQLNNLEKTLPGNPVLTEVLLRVEKLASENNVILSSIQVTPLPRDTNISISNLSPQTYVIQVGTRGSYAQIKNFARSLESMDRLTRVSKISFAVPIDTTDTYLISNLELKISYYGISAGTVGTTKTTPTSTDNPDVKL